MAAHTLANAQAQDKFIAKFCFNKHVTG